MNANTFKVNYIWNYKFKRRMRKNKIKAKNGLRSN